MEGREWLVEVGNSVSGNTRGVHKYSSSLKGTARTCFHKLLLSVKRSNGDLGVVSGEKKDSKTNRTGFCSEGRIRQSLLWSDSGHQLKTPGYKEELIQAGSANGLNALIV